MALHTDIPTHAEIERLLRRRAPGCVSVYLATDPAGSGEAERIELKNLTYDAIEQLREAGMDKRMLWSLEEPLADLVDDGLFWAHLSRSLAVLATPDSVQTFRLPNHLGTLVEVSDRFHLKPLLRSVTFPQAAFVLALAQGSVRLLELSADQPVAEVAVDGLPTDAADAVGKSSLGDRSADRRIQGSEGKKVRLRQYARAVDAAIRPVLAGHDLPLILAATDPLEAIYRSVNSYPHLAGEGISRTPERLTDAEVAAEAREALDGIYAAELATLREVFEVRAAQDRTSVDVAEVARAATFGAVDTVFVDIDGVVPGSIDEESGAVTVDPADDAANYGVVDEIARRVFLTGGRVLAVRGDDIPGDGPAAAILRYRL